MLEKFSIYFFKQNFHLIVGLSQAIETLSVVICDAFHHFIHAPIHISLDCLKGLGVETIRFGIKSDLFRAIGQVLSQKNYEKGHGDVTHALYISASWMSIVPDEQ